MHALYLVIGDESVRGMTTAHFVQIFSVTDFIRIVCRTTESYARLLWKRLKRDTSKFMEVKKDLFLDMQSNKVVKFTTPGMTILGLQRLLMILDHKVNEDVRPVVEDTLARYVNGDTSMLTEVDLDSRESHDNLHYNFAPPLTTH
jgi:hypothetical protein